MNKVRAAGKQGLLAASVVLIVAFAVATIWRLMRVGMVGFAFDDLMRGDAALLWHYMQVPALAALIAVAGMLLLGWLRPMGRWPGLIIAAGLYACADTALLLNAGLFLRNAATEAFGTAAIALIVCALLLCAGQAMGQMRPARKPPQ